jgi:RNA polymerase sigma-70 factor (ECF subfamily)
VIDANRYRYHNVETSSQDARIHQTAMSAILAFPAMTGDLAEKGDERLVSDALHGNSSAFDDLVQRHHDKVDRLCRRFFRDPEVVRDLTQESFGRAFAGLAGYRPELPFAGWLRAIVVNICYDELRRRKRRPEELIPDFNSPEAAWIELVSYATPERIIEAAQERNEAHDLAHRLLDSLKPEDRLVVVLKESLEMSVADIASQMGWTEAKVKIRAFRARRAMRKQAEKILEANRRR